MKVTTPTAKPSAKERPPTAQQAAFAREYVVDFDATAAAKRAKYSEKTAAQIGYQLLQKTSVRALIAALVKKQEVRTEVTADWILGRLVSNVERSMTAEPVRDQEGNETGEYRYEGAVANKALELLGKHKGMFSDKVEMSGNGGGALEVVVRRHVVHVKSE